MAGNARFASGAPQPRASIGEIRRLASGQQPYATVLACADSRVPVEIVFDHNPGEIFVVRIAGNFLSDEALGSIEYAALILKSPLVMVLGHTSCGAVTAAVEQVTKGTRFPGRIDALAKAIAPAVYEARHEDGDLTHNAVVANVRLTVKRIQSVDPVMTDAIREKHVHVVGAVYDLSNGIVNVVT